MSADTVAAGQLRAFVERVERIEADIADLNRMLTEPVARYRYVREVFDRCKGFDLSTTHRAFWLASRIFGTDYDVGKHILQMGWFREDQAPLGLINILPKGVTGAVYRAKLDTRPGEVKIGFTTSLQARQKRLSYLYGGNVVMVEARAGTMLEELATHCANRSHRVVGEWFLDAPTSAMAA